jgi:stearoyl-CoA desaturase (delta-9 desaturase)
LSETATAIQPSPAGVVRVNSQGAFVIRVTALAVILVPLAGFVEAIRLAFAGRVTTADILLFAAMYFVHMGGITMGFHRMLAHRGFNTSTPLKLLLVAMGSTAAQGPLLYWIATHRRHHTYSDQPGDPHSPNLHGEGWKGKLRGLWHAHMPWMLSDEISSWSHYAKDVMADHELFVIHRTYEFWVALGLVVPALIGAWLDGGWAGAWQGFIFGGLTRMFLANQAAWCVGSVSHMFGSRPFNTTDRSANNWYVAIATFGEGLQNNHHAFSSWYRHGVHWWEPDLSGWLLTFMAKLGLIWDTRPPRPELIERLRVGAASAGRP